MKSDRPMVIFGASGFVGANLCRHFLDQGVRVVAVAGTHRRTWRLPAHPRLEVVERDIGAQSQIQRLFKAIKPRVVINCAVYGAYSHQQDLNRIYRVNFEAVRNLLEIMRGVSTLRAFVQTGTSSEYGLNCSGPSEDEATLPDSHYAVSKLSATLVTRFYAIKYKLPAWTLRLYSVYGPFEEPSRLIPQLLFSAQKGQLPPLVSPNISRDFIFAGDTCAAFDHLLRRVHRLPRGEVFNIGSGHRTTIRQLANTALSLFNLQARPKWGSMAARHWDHPAWFSNPSKARRMLQWKARTSLPQGLKATMQWMADHPALIQAAVRNSVLRTRR